MHGETIKTTEELVDYFRRAQSVKFSKCNLSLLEHRMIIAVVDQYLELLYLYLTLII